MTWFMSTRGIITRTATQSGSCNGDTVGDSKPGAAAKPSAPAKASDPQRQQSELRREQQALQVELGKLKRQLAATETTRSTTTDALAKAEIAISRPKTTQQPAATPATDRGHVRRTFDIFEDQLAYLTRASLEDRLAGG